MRVTGHFPRAAPEAASARAFVRETLAGWDVASQVDDVVLIASELFTNAVLHGDGEVEVTLTLTGDHLRLEVADDGGRPVPPRVQSPAADAVTGRGLTIVDALADTWGNGRDRRGRTRVWVELHEG